MATHHIVSKIDSLLLKEDEFLQDLFIQSASVLRRTLTDLKAKGHLYIGSEGCEYFNPMTGCQCARHESGELLIILKKPMRILNNRDFPAYTEVTKRVGVGRRVEYVFNRINQYGVTESNTYIDKINKQLLGFDFKFENVIAGIKYINESDVVKETFYAELIEDNEE